MVTTSGFPKHGNHALVKGVQLLGGDCRVEHLTFGPLAGKHVFIKRDPRNALCSWLRFNNKPVTAAAFVAALTDFGGTSLVAAMAEYEGWLTDPGALVVRYEDLIASDNTLRQIAGYLGLPYITGVYEALPGLTRTWFAVHSDYHALWDASVEAAWSAEGGAELLSRWGY